MTVALFESRNKDIEGPEVTKLTRYWDETRADLERVRDERDGLEEDLIAATHGLARARKIIAAKKAAGPSEWPVRETAGAEIAELAVERAFEEEVAAIVEAERAAYTLDPERRAAVRDAALTSLEADGTLSRLDQEAVEEARVTAAGEYVKAQVAALLADKPGLIEQMRLDGSLGPAEQQIALAKHRASAKERPVPYNRYQREREATELLGHRSWYFEKDGGFARTFSVVNVENFPLGSILDLAVKDGYSKGELACQRIVRLRVTGPNQFVVLDDSGVRSLDAHTRTESLPNGLQVSVVDTPLEEMLKHDAVLPEYCQGDNHRPYLLLHADTGTLMREIKLVTGVGQEICGSFDYFRLDGVGIGYDTTSLGRTSGTTIEKRNFLDMTTGKLVEIPEDGI